MSNVKFFSINAVVQNPDDETEIVEIDWQVRCPEDMVESFAMMGMPDEFADWEVLEMEIQ